MEKLKRSIEEWKVPISVGSVVLCVLFVVATTWAVAIEWGEVKKQVATNTVASESNKKEISELRKNDNSAAIRLAEIQKDVQYIRLILEREESK